MTMHELKTDADVFDATCRCVKRFEIRKNDRDFQVGDRLRLLETKHTGSEMADGAPLEYTGRAAMLIVDYILHGPRYGLAEGWVIMSVNWIPIAEAAPTSAADSRPGHAEDDWR